MRSHAGKINAVWVLSTLVAKEWKSTTTLTSQFLIASTALEYNDRTMHICY